MHSSKLFGKKLNPKELYHKDEISNIMLEVQAGLMNKGISTNNLTYSQMYYILNYVSEHYPNDTFQTLNEFMRFMERGQIENTDVTSYKDLDSLRGAITLASIKELNKELESQVIREFEDDKWLIVRPLTFSASAKYGSSTRWCTTYQREKNYFEKYWRRGILVYFINKKTGYKFAGYKGLYGDSEFSFWNSEDTRVDYLDVDADDYLFPIVRKIFKSTQTNKNLCSDEVQEQVHKECINQYGKIMEIEEPVPMDQPEEPTPNYQSEMNLWEELRPQLTNVPTMRA